METEGILESTLDYQSGYSKPPGTFSYCKVAAGEVECVFLYENCLMELNISETTDLSC